MRRWPGPTTEIDCQAFDERAWIATTSMPVRHADRTIGVVARGFRHGHQPQGGHAEIVRRRRVAVVEVVEPIDKTLQIADTIAVRISEAADEHFVEDSIPPPGRDGSRRGGCSGFTHRSSQGTGRRGRARCFGHRRIGRAGCISPGRADRRATTRDKREARDDRRQPTGRERTDWLTRHRPEYGAARR